MAAKIVCTKCGTVSPAPRTECAKCGGRNARVCGSCGMQNSVAKNFCDQCGHSLTEAGSAAPPAKPLTDTPQGPGPTSPMRLPTPGEALSSGASAEAPFAAPGGGLPTPGGSLPTPGGSLPTPGALPTPGGALPTPGGALPNPGEARPAGLDDLWSPSTPAEAEASKPASEPSPAWRRALNTGVASAAIVIGALGAWRWLQNQRPEVVVPRLAAEYLEALRGQDYEHAYEMFSDEARRSCTLDEFRAIRDTTPWTWSDLRIVHEEPGAFLFAYELQAQGAPVRTDHVLFTQEGERWTRPYNWVLMRQVEDSFEHGNADKGLLLAQAAATINPRDPMAWGYLCEAAYYRRSPQDAEMRCVRALELAQIYPSNLTPKSLYHLHAILADTYTHALAMPDKALEQFGAMLAFPNISPEDQCQIVLARAQAHRQMSRPGEALVDLEEGAKVCRSPADMAFIQNMRDVLRVPPP